MVALVPIADLTGPPGHDATTLDENAAALADMAGRVTGPNVFADYLDQNYVMAKDGGLWAHKAGMKIDGTGNNYAAFMAAIDTCEMFGLTLLVAGPIRIETNVSLAKSVRVKGMTPTAALVMVSNSNSNTFFVGAATTAIGNVAAAAVGDTTLTMQSGGQPDWSGKWIEVTDPAINPLSLDKTLHRRRIISNSPTVATIESPIGYPIPDGMAATVITPVPQVSFEDILIDCQGSGTGSGFNIQYIDDVYVKRLKVKTPGSFTTVSGNGISIYQCNKVITYNMEVSLAGNFGIFTYNCDYVRHYSPHVKVFAGQFGMQLKDNRDAKILYGRSIGEPNRFITLTTTNGSKVLTGPILPTDLGRSVTGTGIPANATIKTYDSFTGQYSLSANATASGDVVATLIGKGDTGFNGKCSGLNDARTQHFIGCYEERSRKSGYELSTIKNEGTGFEGKDFLMDNCTSYLTFGSAFSTIVDAATADLLKDWRWSNNKANSPAQNGYVPSSGMQMFNNRVEGSGFEAVSFGSLTVTTAGDETSYYPVHDISVEGQVIINCCTAHVAGSLSRSAPVLLSAGVQNIRMRNTRSYRVKATDNTMRQVREAPAIATSGTIGNGDYVLAKPVPDNNEFDGWIHVDQFAANALSQDALLQGPNSRMIGTSKLDKYIGTPVINKWRDFERIQTADVSLAAGTKVLAADTDAGMALTLPVGLFTGTLELGYNSSTTGDFQWDLFGGTMAATGYVTGTAPAVNATASTNVASSSYQRVAHGTPMIIGGTGADEWIQVRVRLQVTTAGTLVLRYALNATDAAGIPKVLAGTRLILDRKG